MSNRVQRLKTQIRDARCTLIDDVRLGGDGTVKQAKLTHLRHELSRLVKECTKKGAAKIRHKIDLWGLQDKRCIKALRVDPGQDARLISEVKDADGTLRYGAELQEGMRSAGQKYF